MAANYSLLKFWFCLFLVLLKFSNSESGSLPSSLSNRMKISQRPPRAFYMETAKQVLKASIERQAVAEGRRNDHFVSKRAAPGGPDGQHHEMEIAKQMLKASIARQAAAEGRRTRTRFVSKRVTPGGPDGHHH